jgi:biopolymer transport protein ExbD
MQFQRTARDSPTINLTPLIDVLFLVLMFLVLTATFRGAFVIDLTLPPAESGASASVTAPGVVRIILSQDGDVSVEDRRLTLDELQRLLVDLPDRETHVVLSADGRTPHAGVVAVVDRIRRAGIVGLRIETTPPGREPA